MFGRAFAFSSCVSLLPAPVAGWRPMRIAAGMCLLATLGFGGCAQSPQQIAAASHGKEYFPEGTYGRASRRVIADGQPIPHGGGQYLVGRPYTVAGQTYYPSERRITQVGYASWYGDAFHGRLTANGEIYDRDGFTAAHPTMPLPSYARVTNLRNGYSMIVRVNDRGPYASNRVMDVSRRVAETLDFKRYGTAKVKIDYVGHASLAGSDDAKLLATLRTDGPARWNGEPGEPTMVAEARPAPRVADEPYMPPRRFRELDEDRSLRRVADAEHDAPHYPPRHRYQEPDDETMPPRQRVAVAPRAETRFIERPAAVEAAYQRYGRVHQERPQVAERSPRRYAEAEIDREPSARAYRETPHLPRDLMQPPRFGRGAYDRDAGPPLPPSRRAAGWSPRRPLDLETIPGADSEIHARHHVASLRTARNQDE
ncbi:protein of unknown function [Beijerinckiaceae bacterium RH AL1]|nr:protein of unknown function [Beijerinckiaceae bacterium RH AL1]